MGFSQAFQGLRAKTSQHALMGQVGRLAAGTAVATLSTMLITPILAQLFEPDDWAIGGLVASFTAPTSYLASLGLSAAIIQADGRRSRDQLLAVSLATGTLIAAAATICLFAASAVGLAGFGALDWKLVALAGVGALLGTALRLLRASNVFEERFSRIATATATATWSRLSAHLALGLIHPSALTFVLGRTIGSAVRVAILQARTLRQLRLPQPSLIRSTLHNQRRFPLYVMPGGFLGQVRQAMIIPAIVALYGLELAGTYALITRLIAAPTALVTGSVTDVVHRQATIRTGTDAINGFIRRTALVLFGVAALGAAVAVVTGSLELGSVAFGDEWTQVDAILIAVTPGIAARVVVNPLTRLLIVTSQERSKLVIDLVSILLLACLFVTAPAVGLGGIGFVWAVSIIRVLGYAAYMFLLWGASGDLDADPKQSEIGDAVP